MSHPSEKHSKDMLDEIIRRMRITKEVRSRMKSRLKKEISVWESFLIVFTLFSSSVSLLFLVFGSAFSETQKQIAGLYGILSAVYLIVIGYEFQKSNVHRHVIVLNMSASELIHIINEARSPSSEIDSAFVTKITERYQRSLERFHIDQEDKDFHFALIHNEELKSKTRHSAFIDANRSNFEREYMRSHVNLLLKISIVPIFVTTIFVFVTAYSKLIFGT